MGLMAMVELKQPLEERLGRTADYFAANAKTLPDTYIAAAALDAAGRKPADPAPWIAGWEAVRNPDGSYGKGAPDTASAVILTLRVGGTVKEPATAARALKAAQRPDGGFSLTGGESDLPTVYRMMRALIMLKEKPDVDRLSAFIARCRNADGGYGPTPGQPSTASATYNAAIVMKWIDELAKG